MLSTTSLRAPLFVGALAALLSSGCDPVGMLPTGCTSDDNCTGDQVCRDGTCVDPATPFDAGPGADAGPGVDAFVPVDAGPRADRDNDGLADEDEPTYGADPDNPDTDGDGLSDGDEVALGTDPTMADSDGDGLSDGDEVFLGTDPTMMDRACADAEAEAAVVSRPVDIIIPIDSSGSMNGEIDAVQRNINDNLAQILDAAGIDYRVILVANYAEDGVRVPAVASDGICITAPLGGNTDCINPNETLADGPIDGPRFFHYDRTVASTNSCAILLATYGIEDQLHSGLGGWSEWLRPDALRVFIEISDDDSNMDWDDFDRDLLALPGANFGTVDERNYIWHSIIAMVGQDPPNELEPWPPTDPVYRTVCTPGSAGYGDDYQELSILTGGLRFPLCNNESFNTVFARIAEDVIDGVRLPCSFTPTTPAGAVPDFDRVITRYTPTGGAERVLSRVPSLAECAAGGDYYIVGEQIELCPTLCTAVEGDEMATIQVFVSCEVPCGNGSVDEGEECDDGNLEDGDECDSQCRLPCGNGVLEEGEECDDGNHDDLDGCDSSCMSEFG